MISKCVCVWPIKLYKKLSLDSLRTWNQEKDNFDVLSNHAAQTILSTILNTLFGLENLEKSKLKQRLTVNCAIARGTYVRMTLWRCDWMMRRTDRGDGWGNLVQRFTTNVIWFRWQCIALGVGTSLIILLRLWLPSWGYRHSALDLFFA